MGGALVEELVVAGHQHDKDTCGQQADVLVVAAQRPQEGRHAAHLAQGRTSEEGGGKGGQRERYAIADCHRRTSSRRRS